MEFSVEFAVRGASAVGLSRRPGRTLPPRRSSHSLQPHSEKQLNIEHHHKETFEEKKETFVKMLFHKGKQCQIRIVFLI